jgi:uncharacterized membrane protein
MPQILTALSIWLHALGTVVLIGHYFLLSVIYLPVLAKNSGTALSEISKRSRPWMYLSLVTFMVTGIYLMFADPNYLGVGNFGNLWSVMMLVKHLLILGMIGLGILVQRPPAGGTHDELEQQRRAGHPPFSYILQLDGDPGRSGPASHRCVPDGIDH